MLALHLDLMPSSWPDPTPAPVRMYACMHGMLTQCTTSFITLTRKYTPTDAQWALIFNRIVACSVQRSLLLLHRLAFRLQDRLAVLNSSARVWQSSFISSARVCQTESVRVCLSKRERMCASAHACVCVGDAQLPSTANPEPQPSNFNLNRKPKHFTCRVISSKCAEGARGIPVTCQGRNRTYPVACQGLFISRVHVEHELNQRLCMGVIARQVQLQTDTDTQAQARAKAQEETQAQAQAQAHTHTQSES
jgi:hypothetical protein